VITLIEARNYRCLRSVSQPLGPFQLLIGPNATGKSTLLDVVKFLSRLTTDGLQAAIAERSANVFDLIWQRGGDGFELAVEAVIPEETRKSLSSGFDTFRYEAAIFEQGSDALSTGWRNAASIESAWAAEGPASERGQPSVGRC
jgi:predicted ATPase